MISRGNKKRFGKEVKQVRKGELARDEMVNDNNGQILSDGVEVRRRWAECFEQVLNAECGRCQGDKYQCSSQFADADVGDLNVLQGRSNVGLGSAEDAWTKCLS